MSKRVENTGLKLKALREHAGFTQSNIAKYLKVDQSLISMAERGKRARLHFGLFMGWERKPLG